MRVRMLLPVLALASMGCGMWQGRLPPRTSAPNPCAQPPTQILGVFLAGCGYDSEKNGVCTYSHEVADELDCSFFTSRAGCLGPWTLEAGVCKLR